VFTTLLFGILCVSTYCSDALMLLGMTLLPHAARLHCKPILLLLLQRKQPGSLTCRMIGGVLMHHL